MSGFLPSTLSAPRIRRFLVAAAMLIIVGVLGWMRFSDGKGAESTDGGNTSRRVSPAEPAGRTPMGGKADMKLLYQQSVESDAATDPKLAKLIELQNAYPSDPSGEDGKFLRIQQWIANGQDPQEQSRPKAAFQQIGGLTSLLGTLAIWNDPELKTLLTPEEGFTRKEFAKELVRQDIEPLAFATVDPPGVDDLRRVEETLRQRLRESVNESGAPAELFDPQMTDRLTQVSIGGFIGSRVHRGTSRATKELGEREYAERVGGTWPYEH